MIYGDLAIKNDFIKSDLDAIIQKMELLLKSVEGDWFFNRDFHCNLTKFLFEKYTPWVIDDIKFELSICFNKYLPEVKILKETDIKYDDLRGEYILKIVFKVEGIEGIYNFNYNLKVIQN